MEATVEKVTSTFDSFKDLFEEYKMVFLLVAACLVLLLAYLWFSRGSSAEPSKQPGSVLMNMARVNSATTGMPTMASSSDPIPSVEIEQSSEAPTSIEPSGPPSGL